MKFEMSKEEGRVTLSCPSSITVSGIAECWQELREMVDGSPSSVAIRASGLNRVDTTLLQAFVVLKHELNSRDVPLHWVDCSDEFVRAAKLLGLTEALGVVQ